MSITRRQALTSAGAAAHRDGRLQARDRRQEPIRIGYLPALTGPSSSTGIGINRGIQLAVRRSTRPAASTGARSS